MDYAAAILGRLPGGSRAAGIGELVAELETYLPEEDLSGIIDAYEFASAAHQGQRRMSGESYISHPVAVARILAELHLDAGTLKAALQQAGSAAVQKPRGSPGRELPQDVAGHG
jgi:guanosine-3',5'-bis(diphosphate) 3'-pyrophosphohydrolase